MLGGPTGSTGERHRDTRMIESPRLAVSAGLSDHDVDWEHGSRLGGTLWAIIRQPAFASAAPRTRAEIEANDISLIVARRSPRIEMPAGGK